MVRVGGGVEAVVVGIGSGVEAVVVSISGGIEAIIVRIGGGVVAIVVRVGGGVEAVVVGIGRGVKPVVVGAGRVVRSFLLVVPAGVVFVRSTVHLLRLEGTHLPRRKGDFGHIGNNHVYQLLHLVRQVLQHHFASRRAGRRNIPDGKHGTLCAQ